MEVPLTPSSSRAGARPVRRPRSGRRRRAAADLRAVLRSLRPLVGRAAGARRQAGRPRRLHRAEHARAARVVLRRAADRRGARADQLPADRRTTSPTSSTTAARRSSARTPTTSTRSTASATQLPGVEHFVALEGARAGLARLRGARSPRRRRTFDAAGDRRDATCSRSTTPAARPSRPKGVMITHRNAYMNVVGTLVHHPDDAGRSLPVDAADVPRQRLDVRRGSSPRSAATHVCLRKVEPRAVFELIDARARSRCSARRRPCSSASPTRRRSCARGAPRGVRVLTAGAPPAAATIERIEGELGWTITHVYGLTETAPFITICEPRPEHDALAAGRARARSRRGRASS